MQGPLSLSCHRRRGGHEGGRLSQCVCVWLSSQFGLLRPRDYGRVFRANAKITLPTSSLFLVDVDKRIRMCMHYSPVIGEASKQV